MTKDVMLQNVHLALKNKPLSNLKFFQLSVKLEFEFLGLKKGERKLELTSITWQLKCGIIGNIFLEKFKCQHPNYYIIDYRLL